MDQLIQMADCIAVIIMMLVMIIGNKPTTAQIGKVDVLETLGIFNNK